jgi:signal transduction histidine kinase
VCLNELVQKVVYLLKPVMHKEKVKLELQLAPNLPNPAGNMVRLEQAFLNIMLNAVQQMALKPSSRKTLSVTTTYQAQQETYPIELHFSDTGPGIHRRLWDKIFELGFTTRPGGTGQGLYIARSLVESVGGKIEVTQSVISLGTTFLVALPLGPSLGRGSD